MRPRIDGVAARTCMVLQGDDETYSDAIARVIETPPTTLDLLSTITNYDYDAIFDATEPKAEVRKRVHGKAEAMLLNRAGKGKTASDVVAEPLVPDDWDGLDVEGYAADHSDAYVRALKEFAGWYEFDGRAGPPTAVDAQDFLTHLRNETDWSISTLRLHFYALRSYAKYEGVEIEEPDGTPAREDLIDQLIALGDDLGKTPTAREAHGSDYEALAIHHLQDAFGTFNEALAAAGFEPNETKKGPVTDDQLLDAIIDLRDDLGHWPKAQEMTDEGAHSTSTYHSHFGSYSNAVRKAKQRVKDDAEKQPVDAD